MELHELQSDITCCNTYSFLSLNLQFSSLHKHALPFVLSMI